jgi:pilus assembly protein Flp/PilA
MFHLIGTKVLTAKYTAVAAVKKFLTGKEEGAALVEYGLLVGLIAVIAVAAIATLGTTIGGYFTSINSKL